MNENRKSEHWKQLPVCTTTQMTLCSTKVQESVALCTNPIKSVRPSCIWMCGRFGELKHTCIHFSSRSIKIKNNIDNIDFILYIDVAAYISTPRC